MGEQVAAGNIKKHLELLVLPVIRDRDKESLDLMADKASALACESMSGPKEVCPYLENRILNKSYYQVCNEITRHPRIRVGYNETGSTKTQRKTWEAKADQADPK